MTPPVEMAADGLGYFESPAPVIYLSIVPTNSLKALHRALHEVLEAHCERLHPLYACDRWTPHVTLAMEGLTGSTLAQARRDLSGYRARVQQTLSSLELVEVLGDGRVETVQVYPLQGS